MSIRRMRSSDWGAFSKSAWLQEGDGQLASSKLLRAAWKRRRKNCSRLMKALHQKSNHDRIKILISEMEATAKSSILLLGYAIELYLKAGLVPVYWGCSKELFERDLRKRFSHNLIALAMEIEFPLSAAESEVLKFIQQAVVDSARYPLLSPDERAHIREWNKLTEKIWDEDRYKRTVQMAGRIRKHASLIDQDESNPASLADYKIDEDGYFAFRCGGRISTRITVKYSTKQKSAGFANKAALRRLMISDTQDPVIAHYWDNAIFREVQL